MKNKRKGFTLAEVLICVVIIGFIITMSMTSLKIIRTSYTSLTYFAFKNIQDMVGELYSGSVPLEDLLDEHDSKIHYPVTKCIKSNPNGRVIVSVLESDNEHGENMQGLPLCSERVNIRNNPSNIFCHALAAIVNTSGTVNCDNLQSVAFNNSNHEPYIPNLNKDMPNFRATNGQIYYISQWDFNPGVSNTYGYRLIAVDLNSTSRPNIYDEDGISQNVPDIVTFMVLDNGEVFPLGVAADNVTNSEGKRFQYLTSQVKGYYYSYDKDRTDSVPSECTKWGTCNFAVVPLKNESGSSFFSYRQAYCTAIGNRNNEYANYCAGIAPSELCPPSSADQSFDMCRVENIKPMFRYNFK